MSATGDPRAAGFTLIEALVVLAVSALVSGLLFPRLQSAMAAQEFRSATGAAALALARTRADAIRTGRAARFDATGLRLPASVRLSTGERPLLFFPDGTSSGGGLALVAGARVARFSVTPQTGLVRSVRS